MRAVKAVELGLVAGFVLTRTALRAATGGLPTAASGGGAVPISRPRGESRTVIADDGVELHAEIQGDPRAPVTVVLCHGYALSGASWSFQTPELARHARVVTWDQRGHGRSGRGPAEHATVDQLGRDLRAVIESTAPRGPVVVAGHSMGGMTVMALAEQCPELFGTRIAAVALLATSAEPVLGDLGLPRHGMRALHRVTPWALALLHRVTVLSGPLRELAGALVPRHAFASEVPPHVADFLVEQIGATPLDVLADFFPQFRVHDKVAALAALHRVGCLVLAGADDIVTPPEHSEAIARAVPGAELVVLPHAGHAFPLEHPEAVNTLLVALLRRHGRLRTA
ncbi:alpha/beta hydrolase [Amycolatopsis endophytica]|uniref:Pimeloyl-ACP methyl ester carboxylesterase n=1 Tax=Amycolatopsis endophytica TaxID=860233 RepID=A0A853BDF0_9PSEU|nr:alpha/beta hydrolase [Amycolatopsis endophytica]NYI92774.1 pimeloyl-ACP methyl ester carboxylesterase [Amycolatopsis endophytica]